jgi:transposase, IS6 family
MSLVQLPGASAPARSAFSGFRFPREVIVLAVRWYLRFGLSYRDVEELPPSAALRWITSPCTGGCAASRRCWPTRPGSAGTESATGGTWTRPTSGSPGGGSTCIGRSTSSGRSSTCTRRVGGDSDGARRFFQRARKSTGVVPVEVITDRAPIYPAVVDELWSAAWHHVERYANNGVEADHAQLKRRLHPMRGIKTMAGLRILAAGHAFVQNLRRGHYEIAPDQPRNLRLAVAFRQLATAI